MMNKRIRSMIDEIFSEMKMTAENLALRDELMANAQARFDDAITQGKTEEAAFAEVAGSLENVSDLLREMNGEAPQTDAENDAATPETDAPPQSEAPQTDLGDALNEAFSALGRWGQSIMPQAKKFARQMDDATGGMLSDIGRAVNKGMQDAQRAAGDVLDKYQQSAQDAPFTPQDTPCAPQTDFSDLCEETPAQEAPLYGADGELDEAAFARSVEQVTREAEAIIDEIDQGTHDFQRREVRFPAAGLRRIDAKLDADDITVRPTDGDEIVVFWSAQDAENEPEVSLYHHTLTIRRKNPDVFKTFFSVFSKNGGQITLLIPRGYGADYALSTTSGDIRLSGLDVENANISTTSGGIRVEPDLTVRAGKIKAETVSGSVTVSAVAQAVEADSVSGEVFISCDAASVKGDVVSGKLHIEGACDNWDVDAVSGSAELICTTVPTGKIKIDTISGGVKLYLPESIRGFAVDFDSMGGSLRNEFGPDRFGTCTLPIKMDTISGKMLIAPLQA